MSGVTQILAQIEAGDPHAPEQLLPLVYSELRDLAAARLFHESAGQTLQATALVHEAYLRLVGDGKSDSSWQNRAHFFAAAAEAMRRILVENARRKGRVKHGGNRTRLDLETTETVVQQFDDELLSLDEALARLEAADPDAAQLVKLRYFAGLTIPEAGKALGISSRSVDRLWAYARAWLYQDLYGQGLTAPKDAGRSTARPG